MSNLNKIETEQQLREIISDPGARLKVIDSIEEHSLKFIQNAPVVALSTRNSAGLAQVALEGGQPGFVEVVNDTTILLMVKSEIVKINLQVNPYAGLLFFVPGIKDTLRINGQTKFLTPPEKLAPAEPLTIELKIDELYMHCPKAFIRSSFWNAPQLSLPAILADYAANSTAQPVILDYIDEAARNFIGLAPFVCLGTVLAENQADLSPRGDPAGFVQILDSRTLLIPERPGNHLADSLRNILNSATAGLLFLIPGFDFSLAVSGQASLTKDPELLALLEVKNKIPLLAIRLEVAEVRLEYTPVLGQSGLWDAEKQLKRETFATLGQILVDQLQPRGIIKNVSGEEVEASIQKDSEKNLY